MRQRHWSLALLFAVSVLNIFDRQIINILAQDIKSELRISDASLGLLTGTAFGIFYALMGLPLGRLGDRVDRVKLISGALALWSGFTLLCGFAGNFLQLFLSRVGVGVGEAASQPASSSLIPDLFPQQWRTSALSVLLLGVPVGSFLGLLVGGYVGSRMGWRAGFMVAGAPGLILAGAMLLTLRDPRKGPPAAIVSRERNDSILGTLGVFARNSRLKWLALALTSATFLVYGSGAWLPALLMRMHAMTQSEVGLYCSIAVGLGGGVGALGSGIVCDALRSRVRHVEAKLLLTALACSIPTLLVTVLSPERWLALPAMALFDISAFAYLGPLVRLIQNDAGENSRGLALAVCQSISNILSLACGLPLVGAISDAFAPSQGSGAIRYALALTLPTAALLGMFACWQVLRTHARQVRTIPGVSREDSG